MITAQDIREKGFEKSKFNGYDMDSVDDFLEEVADSIGILQKEKADLQREKGEMAKKMKVLVDKINDYRSNEEALNLAVISAQKLAVQIEADARTRAAAMLADADKQVKARLGSIEEQTVIYERRLADAKAAAAKYIENEKALCAKQLKDLEAISIGANIQPEADKAAGGEAVDAGARIQDEILPTAPVGDFFGARNGFTL